MQAQTTHGYVASITETKKGHRIWIQGVHNKGLRLPFYSTAIHEDRIVLEFGPQKFKGMRKVTQDKGGIIDLTSKKITAWAKGATEAAYTIDGNTLVIKRA